MLNLLNNLKILNNKFIQQTYTYFRGFINRIKMDQGEGHMQEEEQHEQANEHEENAGILPEQIQYEPLQNLALEEIGANVEYVGMDVVDDNSSNESDDEDGNNVADDDDDDDEDDDEEFSNYDELEEMMDQESCSSDEYDILSEMDPEYAIRNFRRMHKMFIKRHQELKKPAYSFQPLRLIQCHYKNRHDSWSYPIARSGHRIIASESHLYSLGGYNPKRRTNAMRRGACMLFQELWAYNFATNTWKLLHNADNCEMPRELASNALAIYNNVLIVSIIFIICFTMLYEYHKKYTFFIPK